jgi:hypothetical protein
MIYRVSTTIVLVVAMLIAGLALLDQMRANAQNTACYTQQGGAMFVAASGCEYEFQSGSVLDVQSGATVSFGGDATMSGDLVLSAQTAISVTNGGVITATGAYQPLESAAEVTATIAAGSEGATLVLVNTANTTINIADTGAAKLSAAAALGQYDSLTLISDGANWIEVSRSNN